MSFSPTPRQIVLEEVFDEASLPTDEEIYDYALRIGINIESETHLLHLAQDGLMQALPPGWKPCYDEDRKEIYYFNFKSGKAQWEHPLDDVYRNLVKKARSETNTSTPDQLDEDSKTSLREDLKSFEEASVHLPSSEMYPRPRVLEPLSALARSPPHKKSDEPEVRKRPNSSDIRNRRNIGPMEFRHLSKQDIITPKGQSGRINFTSDSKDEGYGTEMSVSSLEAAAGGRRELTLSGGGSMFLKHRLRSLEEPGSQPRSILREQRQSRDMSPVAGSSPVSREMPYASGVTLVQRRDDADDDRKSVRFNLEKELKTQFELPDASSESEDVASAAHKTEETRQIELDFDDLQLRFEDMDVPKKPKLKSSRQMIQEFRDLFESRQEIEDKKASSLVGPDDVTDVKEKRSSQVDVHNDVKEKRSSQVDVLNDVKEKRSSQGDVLNDVKYKRSSQVDVLNDINEPERKETSLGPTLSNLADKRHIHLDSLIDMKRPGQDGGNLIDLSDQPDTNSSDTNSQRPSSRLKDEIFDSNFGTLVDFAMKKKVFELGAPKEPDPDNAVKAKSDKLDEMDKDFRSWLIKTERKYQDNRESQLKKMKEDLERQEEEQMKKFEDRLKEMRLELAKKEKALKERLEVEQKERLKALKKEIETKEQRELEMLKKSFEERLEDKKKELLDAHTAEIARIEKDLGNILSDQRSQKLKELDVARENEAAIETMRLELKENYQKQKNNLLKEHDSLLENLKMEQAAVMERMRTEARLQEEMLGRERKDGGADTRVFEKMRCEKRLLEDKYKTLKEKYIRLKTDAKVSLEKKSRRKEGGATTGSETEKSVSYKTNAHKESGVDRKQIKLKKHITNLDNMNQNVSMTTTDEERTDSQRIATDSPKNWPGQLSPSELKGEKEQCRKHKKNEERKKKLAEDTSSQLDDTSCEEKKAEARKRRQLFSKLKAASTSRLNMNKSGGEKDDTVVSLVENLRRQLKKLEELEDQFPMSTHTDTYMRYPFTETSPQLNSSELEFFKHRIHVERDSVRRAKEFLKTQKKCFELRQRELKKKLGETGTGGRKLMDQICQEEKELTDMEVSVHRTRALLGEKIIRLRHLEQSLRRVSKPEEAATTQAQKRPKERHQEDGTLSDLSSHSGSSGFSSTDFNQSDQHYFNAASRTSVEHSRRQLQNNIQEPTEIIVSLENLNSEIREIWEVLKQQQKAVPPPPPPLVFQDLTWPDLSLPLPRHRYMTQVTAGSNLGHVTTVVDSSLVDRTRSLRDWLKAARSSTVPADSLVSPNQVTL